MKRLLVDCEETSLLTGIGIKRLYRLAAHNAIPGVIRVGRSVRFSLPTLLRWLGTDDQRIVSSDHAEVPGNRQESRTGSNQK